MPQNLLQTVTNTFVKGLITEAGPLTFPKDASIDELNCTLERDGSRRRRLSLQFEENYITDAFTVVDADLIQTYVWNNVGGDPATSFVVVQVGSDLIFYSLDSETVSTNRIPTSSSDVTPYVVDLTSYEQSGSAGAENFFCDFCTTNGRLVVVSPGIDAIVIDRDVTSGAFTIAEIALEERDFEWIGKAGDDYSVELASASVSDNRKYDTKNAGWITTNGSAARTTYIAAKTAWPPLTHPWYAGKDSSGNFSVTEFDEVYSGNSLTANGHFIYSIFDKDRATESSTSGASSYTLTKRFSTVAEYASRVFYSGLNTTKKGVGSRIYFSQLILDNEEDIGKCYQINDPTSEEFSDLLDTDGGFISIPEAYNIKKLHVFGPVLYVFAENGVWSISGVDDVFRATEYSVSKLTEVGLRYKESFVSADGRPYWWSNHGIHTLVLNDQIGTIVEQNISQSTIQTFWRNLTEAQRRDARGFYDVLNKRVMWAYSTAAESVTTKFTNALIFDEVFTAFYPWTWSNNTASVVGMFFKENTVPYEACSAMKVLVRTSTNGISFAEFIGTDFLDWGVTHYESYAEAGYDFMGDLTTFKNSPYVTSYLMVTEEGFNVDQTAIRPSSCLMSAYWDFSFSPSTSQEIYKLKYPVLINESDLTDFDYPETVVTSRTRVRGRGRSMRLRFDASQGYDFHLLGWEVVAAKNPSV